MKFHPTNRPDEWAYVDDKHAWVIEAGSWCVNSAGYLWGRWQGRNQLLHRVLAAIEGHEWSRIDHANRNSLDCRTGNLRPATGSQNIANSGIRRNNKSGYKGVCWDKGRNKWLAAINLNRRHIHIGRFDCKVEAARAYDDAARKHFGEFAVLNFPS